MARRQATVLSLLVLWCLMSLSGGVPTALCLDDGGDCSPSTAVPLGPCHAADDIDIDTGCGSCIDIAVPSDGSIVSGRPDDDLRVPLAALMPASANGPCAGPAGHHPPVITSPPGAAASLSTRTAVLRI